MIIGYKQRETKVTAVSCSASYALLQTDSTTIDTCTTKSRKVATKALSSFININLYIEMIMGHHLRDLFDVTLLFCSTSANPARAAAADDDESAPSGFPASPTTKESIIENWMKNGKFQAEKEKGEGRPGGGSQTGGRRRRRKRKRRNGGRKKSKRKELKGRGKDQSWRN